jgi:hypothetical protein
MRTPTALPASLTILAACLAAATLYACGSSGGGNGGPGGNGDGGGAADGTSSGGQCLTCGADGGGGADGYVPPVFEDGGFSAGDCEGGDCSFPAPGAPLCTGAPPINVVYPVSGTLVPPDMNVMSVMWTPYGSAYKTFEVDFTNSVTYMHVVTKCATQTVDTEQPPQPSGGCELQLDPTMWAFVAHQNAGGPPVSITVRGTTDGTCANTSSTTVDLSFSRDPILGAIYYWKSTITSNGVGGQVWVKSWGDSTPEQDVTSAFGSSCNGCHALSRDGQRMVINSDDDDSDDEYGDVRASLIDMTTQMPIGGTGGGRVPGNMGPGFATFYPDHSRFLLSNGLGSANAPTNQVLQYDGNTGAMDPTVNVAGQPFVTMPDWSPDGKSVLFVVPKASATWDGQSRNDDDHIFGGSLFTMPYSGNGAFGAAAPLVTSGGENNYYPSYSPDGTLVVFNRAAQDTSVTGISGCQGSGLQVTCPNDSFSNPNARLMVLSLAQGAAPVDLTNANGSPASSPLAWSNSWPKWSPFLQTYNGHQLLWIAFSSTRDYGLRVRNHQPGMFQCYPADSYEQAGAAHHSTFSPQCQQPQIWMAAVDVTEATTQIHPLTPQDSSFHAFWLPFQDITTHNHTPQWTQAVANMPPPDAGACAMASQSCTQGQTCCSGLVCGATGVCVQITQ